MLKRRIWLVAVFITINIFTLLPCPFCNNLKNYSMIFNKLYSKICQTECMILMQTNHFYVLSDDYPVAYGHLLIVPKEHITSFVSIDIGWNSEIAFILSELKKIFGTDEYVLFEHGCRLSGETVISSGNSVYHAHLHFIPNLSINELEVKEILVKNGLQLKNNVSSNTSLIYPEDLKVLSFLKQNTESIENGEKFFESYLFLKYKKDRAIVIPESCMASKVPSQFFRKMFAIIANDQTAFWDWKNPVSSEVVKILQDRFLFSLAKFKQNKLK
jgi:diadenosine tetraphosphate (Ap4A) HIT family hydrolase